VQQAIYISILEDCHILHLYLFANFVSKVMP